MRGRGAKRVEIAVYLGFVLFLWSGVAMAQQEPAVQRGVQYLRTRAGTKNTGESAMMALALLKAEVPAADPGVQACLAKINARFEGTNYKPEMQQGQGTYEAAVSAMVLTCPGWRRSTAGCRSVPALTVNRLCGSGLQAIVSAAQAIMLGDCEAAVAGGAEVMSRAQYWLPGMRWGQRMGDGTVIDSMTGALSDPFEGCHMGVTAENVATDFHVSRADQDALAAESHRRAAAAQAAGYFTEHVLMGYILDSGRGFSWAFAALSLIAISGTVGAYFIKENRSPN